MPRGLATVSALDFLLLYPTSENAGPFDRHFHSGRLDFLFALPAPPGGGLGSMESIAAAAAHHPPG